MTEEEWDAIMTVHLRGHVQRRARHHRPLPQPAGRRLRDVSSTSGLIGNVGQANYGAAKMGIAGLSRIIAMEGARNNVRSNAVAPVARDPDDRIGAARRERAKRARGHARRSRARSGPPSSPSR